MTKPVSVTSSRVVSSAQSAYDDALAEPFSRSRSRIIRPQPANRARPPTLARIFQGLQKPKGYTKSPRTRGLYAAVITHRLTTARAMKPNMVHT